MAKTNRQTFRQMDSMTESAQWGRFGENTGFKRVS